MITPESSRWIRAETVRLNPVSLLIRYLHEPLEFERGGLRYHLPAGQAVVVSPAMVNRDPTRVHARPDDYDPDRHAVRPAVRTASWGHGAFGCVAQEFSRAVTAGVLAELLTMLNFDLLDEPSGRRCRVHQTYPGAPLRAAFKARPALVALR